MEVERWQALLCVLETGSLTAAAARMHCTASGMSRMMAALEDEAGFRLLYRGREGVRPTAECEALLPAVRAFLESGARCRQQAARIRGLETGTVTVGTAYAAYYGLLSRVTAQFRRLFPGVKVQIRGGYSSELMRMLEERRLDICLVSRREGSADWIPLGEDGLVAWLPPDHPLAACPDVPVEAFASEPYIEIFPSMDSDNARVFRRFGIEPDTQFATTDSLSACAMVRAGLGIAMNNSLNSEGLGGMAIRPLRPAQAVEIGIAVRKDLSPAAGQFLQRLVSKEK